MSLIATYLYDDNWIDYLVTNLIGSTASGLRLLIDGHEHRAPHLPSMLRSSYSSIGITKNWVLCADDCIPPQRPLSLFDRPLLRSSVDEHISSHSDSYEWWIETWQQRCYSASIMCGCKDPYLALEIDSWTKHFERENSQILVTTQKSQSRYSESVRCLVMTESSQRRSRYSRGQVVWELLGKEKNEVLVIWYPKHLWTSDTNESIEATKIGSIDGANLDVYRVEDCESFLHLCHMPCDHPFFVLPPGTNMDACSQIAKLWEHADEVDILKIAKTMSLVDWMYTVERDHSDEGHSILVHSHQDTWRSVEDCIKSNGWKVEIVGAY